MNISESNPGNRVKNVQFSEDRLIVDLQDGRMISVPLTCVPQIAPGNGGTAPELGGLRGRLRHPLARAG